MIFKRLSKRRWDSLCPGLKGSTSIRGEDTYVCFGNSEFISAGIRSFLLSICNICINFYSYSILGTDKNNTKIKMLTVLLTTIRKARNYSQYHLG